MLFLRQFAFPHNALMLFVCALDAVFELPSVVRQLFGHFMGSPRHIATDCALDIYGLANMELMRWHRSPLLQPAGARPCGECFLEGHGDSAGTAIPSHLPLSHNLMRK